MKQILLIFIMTLTISSSIAGTQIEYPVFK